MKIFILSINHQYQRVLVGSEVEVSWYVENTELLRTIVRGVSTAFKIDLICEESDPCYLSVAQQEAFTHTPRIPWKNINMTAQERLEAGVWEANVNRPFDLGPNNPIRIDYRIPEDDIREEFFKTEILKVTKEVGALSVLILCGDAHVEALKAKLEGEGREVTTDHQITPVKYWK
jgi:hypothetical protein